MKKNCCFILLTAVMLTALTACGAPEVPDCSEEVPVPAGSVVSESTSVPAATADTSDPEVQEVRKETMEPFRTEATIEETVMYEEGGLKITATGLTYTAYSADLNLTIENNSGRDLTVLCGTLGYSCNSVNGYMLETGYLNCDVTNGKTANTSISFSQDSLMIYGIHEIADMEIGFDIRDDDQKHHYSGPLTLRTSAFDSYDYETEHYRKTITGTAAMDTYSYEMLWFSQELPYEENGVKLLSAGLMCNRDKEEVVLLELENTTDRAVFLYTADIGINGLKLTSGDWSADRINPGKRCIAEVRLAAVLKPEYREAYGITEVGSVTFLLRQRSEEGVEIAGETPVKIDVPGAQNSYDRSGTEVYQNNGLRILAKTVVKDSSSLSDGMHVLLLAENNSGRTLAVDDVYGSLSVNGVMTDYSCYREKIGAGETAALMIELWGSSLEKNQITATDDVREVELKISIEEGYSAVEKPTVRMTFGEQG